MTELLDRNLKAIALTDPTLAKRLQAMEPEEGMVVDQAKTGHPSLRARALDGAEIRIHSAYDPIGEAKKFITARKSKPAEAYVLSGLGLGYSAVELSRVIPKESWLILVEAKERLFRGCLDHVDLSGLFSRPRTRVFIGTDWVHFLDWSRLVINDSEAQQLNVLTYPPCARLAPQFYERVGKEFETALNRWLVEVNTLVRQAPVIEENAMRNVAFLPESHGVHDLKGCLKGIPGIVVASGPSLADNIDLVKEFSGRCALLTVGKSLRMLAQKGVEPDFTAALDMSRGSQEVYEGFEIPKKTILVNDGDSYFGVARNYPGRKVSYETFTPITLWAASIFGALGVLDKGLSVAHTAFYLARILGLDPIILVGVDLALARERTHAEGVSMTWGTGGKMPHATDYIDVPSVNGGKVKSLKNFLSFVTAFEVAVSHTKAKVINTSPDGALIRGTENMSLQDAAGKYLTREYDITSVLDQKLSVPRTFSMDQFHQGVEEFETMMAELMRLCDEGNKLHKRANRLTPSNKLDQAELRKLGVRLDKYEKQVLNGPWTRYLNRLLSLTALELKNLNREKKDHPEKVVEIELNMMGIIFRRHKWGAETFLGHLRAMRDELLQRQGKS